jgi:sugar phosphate isomerase/epimerase
MKKVGKSNFGTLPDFGNFGPDVDRYEAVKKMMPYAKGVSFKCYDFGADGKETSIDMDRMMKIVQEAGYKGFVGIEYEGKRLSELEGAQAGKKFLDKYAA